MTELDRLTHQRDWTERLAKQPPHPVHQPLEILWDQPWDAAGATVRRRTRLAVDESFLAELRFHEHVEDRRVTWEQVKALQTLQKDAIKRMARDRFNFGFISEYFRPILINLCRKRLAHPGEVIEYLVTGGNRPGKTTSLIHLLMMKFIYPAKPPGMEDDKENWSSQIMLLHETETQSRKWHHPEIFKHLPAALRLQARKKSDEDTAFNYNAKGFTNEWFKVFIDVVDETGRKFIGGGRCEMRNYGQDEDSFQGGEYDTIFSDELVPPNLVITFNARLASRVWITAEEWFLARIRAVLKELEDGVPFDLIHRAALGLILQGVHLIGFTPIKFYTATVKMFLAGAQKYGWTEAPVLKTVAGTQETRVPRHAQPTDPLRGVSYIPTSANIFKPSYHAIMGGARSGGARQLRMKLYGDVEQDVRTEFGADWKPEKHLCDWKDIPRDGTLYEVIDGAEAKPYFIGWWIVDKLNRQWMVQEWPCESIPINGGLPGPWAVISQGDRMNGDEGPAQDLRLGWPFARYAGLMWEMRARLLRKMKETGEPWRGKILKLPADWQGETPSDESASTPLEDYAEPYETWGDPRWADWKNGSTGASVEKEFYDLPHGFALMLPPGVTKSKGNDLIRNKLNSDFQGAQMVRVNRECTNTIFMFSNYTLPEFSEQTKRNDEACSDPNAVWRYFELARPEMGKGDGRPKVYGGGGYGA